MDNDDAAGVAALVAMVLTLLPYLIGTAIIVGIFWFVILSPIVSSM